MRVRVLQAAHLVGYVPGEGVVSVLVKPLHAAVREAKKQPRVGQAPDMPKTGSEPGADKRDPEDSKPEREGARKGKGALFRVYGDGRLAQLHALTATYFSDVVVTETGAVFAGAGDKGRVYLVDTDDSVSTAFDVDERIIARMIYEPGEGLSFATTDPGR